jgi:hypothetical protein
MNTFAARTVTSLFCLAALLPQQEAPAQEPALDPDEILIGHMETIEDGLHALRKQISRPELYAEALEPIVSMQQSAKACKLMAPPMSRSLAEGERAGFLLAYRQEMILLEESMLALERALLNGEVDAVKQAFKDLRDMEEPAHERFVEEK